jgi:stage IV sporulation protein B
LFLLVVCFLSAYFITSIIVFPNDIKLIEGEKQYFNFKLPFKAIIEPETITTLTIDNKKVDSFLEFNLYKTAEVFANEPGAAKMRINAFGVNLKEVSVDFLPNKEIIPCGGAIGVKISTDGIMALGTGYVNAADGRTVKPAEGIIRPGDIIKRIDGENINTRYEFRDAIASSEGKLKLTILRDNETLEKEIEPVTCKEDNIPKIGLWIRDSTRGIGTITYYDPETKKFGALGHGIVDVDTKKLMTIKEGRLHKTLITAVKEGKKGSPGELVGEIVNSEIIGEITNNSSMGVYGTINAESVAQMPQKKMRVALQNEIHEGPAKIFANVEADIVKEYDIYIETINRYSKDDSKGMVIKITDPDLLDKTGGIVQGMSGSPIIQDDKIIGAVTHVFVQDPTKGYGIFIENMLKQEKKIN